MSGEDKKYLLFATDSMRLFAEQVGFAEIPDQVLASLSEDVNFRLREVVNNSAQFMKHSKRRKLTCEDVDRSLKWSDCQPVFGYGINAEPLQTVHVKEAQVFAIEDPPVDLLSLAEDIISSKYKVSVKTDEPLFRLDWLSVEGQLNDALLETNDGLTAEAKAKREPRCSPRLEDYYDQVTRIILGNDEKLLQRVLQDLATNPRLQPILPNLVTFVSVGVKKLNYDLERLRKLLRTCCALFKNSHLYLATEPYLSLLVQSVLYCLEEPLAASINPINDHWTLRDAAANLLALILKEWCSSHQIAVISLWEDTINHLRNCITDPMKPFSSHYGAIVAIAALGPKCILEHLCPLIPIYWNHLEAGLHAEGYSNSQVRADAQQVYGALVTSSTILVREMRVDALQGRVSRASFNIYSELSKFFGDSMSSQIPADCSVTRTLVYGKQPNKITTTLFTTKESLQTGEELLDAFYEAPAVDDEVNSYVSLAGDYENSYENSGASDNEKEAEGEAGDVDLQIKSTISDPSLGIKMTIRKLRRIEAPFDDHQDPSRGPRKKKRSLPKPTKDDLETVFEEYRVPSYRPLIIISINGCSSHTRSRSSLPANNNRTTVEERWFRSTDMTGKYIRRQKRISGERLASSCDLSLIL